MSESTADPPSAYWAAFGYQNHLLPLDDPGRPDGALTAPCGVLTTPADTAAPDERRTCSVCTDHLHHGHYRLATPA